MDRIARLPAKEREVLFLETASRKCILPVVTPKNI